MKLTTSEEPVDPNSLLGEGNGNSHELESRFRQLAKSWKEGTAHLGSMARMAKHPAYQEISSLGAAAVPLLLAELHREPDFWFNALRTITGENPVPESSAGKIDEMSQAWLEWGRERGFIR